MVVLTNAYRLARALPSLLLVFAGIFLCAPTYAQQAKSADVSIDITLKTMVPTLVASPNLCELPKGVDTCRKSISLIWEVPKAGSFCLWQSGSSQALQCWQNVWSGTYQIDINTTQGISFHLTRGDEGPIVAQTTFTVVNALEQRLRAKRRRGFWRLF